MIDSFSEFSVVVLTREAPPPSVEPAEFPMLGTPTSQGRVQTPVIVAIPFEEYVMELAPGRAQIKAGQANSVPDENIVQGMATLIDNYYGRKTIRGVGFNWATTEAIPPGQDTAILTKLLTTDLVADNAVGPEVGLQIFYHPADHGEYRIQSRIEAGRLGESGPHVIQFAFNFHRDWLNQVSSYSDLIVALRPQGWMYEEMSARISQYQSKLVGEGH